MNGGGGPGGAACDRMFARRRARLPAIVAELDVARKVGEAPNMNGNSVPLFGRALDDRQVAARDLGILSPPEYDPVQSRLVLYLSRMGGEWLGVIQTSDRELERFTADNWGELMEKMVAIGTVLAAGVTDDETWAEALEINASIAGGPE